MTDYRTHPEYRALLAAVCAAPGDDLPRLVLADWLEEHGEHERAEFIRVGCRIPQIEAMLANPYHDQDLCTEVSANWCPVCGDCCCPNPEVAKDEPNCPLHSWMSRHESDDAVKMVLADLRRRERELWEENVRESIRPMLGELFPGQWCVHIDSIDLIVEDIRAVIVRRGFVSEVRCTLADWCGGELCHYDLYASGPCPQCGDTGRTTGIGPRLVREHPVERVVVARAFAHYHFDSVANEWTFEPWPTIGRLGAIPQFIFDHIHGWKRRTPIQGWKVFDSEVSALDALSAALIAWAKSQEVSYE